MKFIGRNNRLEKRRFSPLINSKVFTIKFRTLLSNVLAFFLITDCTRNHVKESECAEQFSESKTTMKI